MRRHPVARFHVGGDRNGNAARDAGDGREHFIAADALAIHVAQAERDARAGRREGREARLDEDARAARVPGVGQHEHRPLDVEPAQYFGFGGAPAHRARR